MTDSAIQAARPAHAVRALCTIAASALATMSIAGCSVKGDSADLPTFVQPEQVAQWLADNECDQSGAVQGYPSYGGEDWSQIAEETFVCDNGKSFLIQLREDGTYTYTKNGG